MRIDLFAVWFMNGLMSRPLEQPAVSDATLPTNAATLAARLAMAATSTVTLGQPS